ncbi:MAG: nicotinate-nucleotide adenylyltransferase [Nitrospirota bacterium]
MRLGLFGGTFNPIHICHLAIAAQTRDRMGLDRVLFIPTGDPPHKPPGVLAPAEHRCEMVRLAIAGEPTFALTDIEIRRPTKSYSIDTVRELHRDYGASTALFFIIGLDAFLDFDSWREAPTLLRLCHFVVVSRPGALFRSFEKVSLLPPIEPAQLSELDADRKDRVDVQIPGGRGLSLLRLPPCMVSASDIRNRIRQRLSLANLLPTPVESYIIQHKLYLEDADRTGV